MSEPTPTKGYPVTLDRERRLRFSLGSLRKVQEDQSLGNVLFQGLRHEDPELTLEDVEELVTLDIIGELHEPLKKATGGLVDLRAMLGLDDADEGENAPEKKGTGGADEWLLMLWAEWVSFFPRGRGLLVLDG